VVDDYFFDSDMKNKYIIGMGTLILMTVAAAFTISRLQHWQSAREAEMLLTRELPPIAYPSDLATGTHASINLPVPFTTQAPHANWDMPYQEACEEAAALMAIRYVFGNPIFDAEDADAGILDLVKANEDILGYPADQTAKQLRDLILEIDPKIPVALLSHPSVDDLRKELSQGNVVIVPAAGRKLLNPFYRQPGPLYHMIVLRGYTEDGYFITNDPGTKKGEGYLYPFDVVMEAMGDWNNGKPEKGEKVVLVLQPL
jgi:hypothetical protein